jgi:hypothetical protein
MRLEKQGAKPSGPIGNIKGRMMNILHTPIYVEYIK